MKKLLASIFLVSILFSCNRGIKTTPIVNKDTTVQIIDTVIEHDNLFPTIADIQKDVNNKRNTTQLRPTKPPVVTTTGYKCIYIDFDGYAAANASWQGGVYSTYAPSGFDSTQMQLIKDRVGYYYQSYNVIITTDESVYLGAAINNRIRVVVTTTSAWYQGVSGITYIGSFTWGDNTPCFVFPDRLGYSATYTGDIVAHESGHSIGLSHQSQYDSACTLINNYRQSCIMGYPFNTTTPLWAIGATPSGCNVIQDDKGVLANKLQLK